MKQMLEARRRGNVECKNCSLWNPLTKKCKDPEEWVDEETGEPVCRFRVRSVPREKTGISALESALAEERRALAAVEEAMRERGK